MKKTWNKLIIVSFIVLAVVACAAILFLYPYYNEYKVFDGIEAGQWNEVQKSYEALDSEKQKAVQEMLPDYAKHICLEYQTGEKDYIYTVAAYDAINSIDETKSICTKYNVLVNRTDTGMRSNRFIIQTRITMDRVLCRRTRRSTRSIFDWIQTRKKRL